MSAKKTYKVKQSDLIRSIEGFPIEIVQKMVDYQVEQGYKANVEEFQDSRTVKIKGFDWERTPEGWDFWSKVLSYKEFHIFFKKYPKDSCVYAVRITAEEYKLAHSKVCSDWKTKIKNLYAEDIVLNGEAFVTKEQYLQFKSAATSSDLERLVIKIFGKTDPFQELGISFDKIKVGTTYIFQSNGEELAAMVNGKTWSFITPVRMGSKNIAYFLCKYNDLKNGYRNGSIVDFEQLDKSGVPKLFTFKEVESMLDRD